MFWKGNGKKDKDNRLKLNSSEIVTQVAKVYGDYCDKGVLIRPHSSLPCSWFTARECFFIAFEAEYLEISEELRKGYHEVYRELALFIEDDLYKAYNYSLNVAAKCQIERFQPQGRSGVSMDIDSIKRRIVGFEMKTLSREEIWKQLAMEEKLPKEHLAVLAEILSYCSGLYRAMWNEWAAFANLTAYRKLKTKA